MSDLAFFRCVDAGDFCPSGEGASSVRYVRVLRVNVGLCEGILGGCVLFAVCCPVVCRRCSVGMVSAVVGKFCGAVNRGQGARCRVTAVWLMGACVAMFSPALAFADVRGLRLVLRHCVPVAGGGGVVITSLSGMVGGVAFGRVARCANVYTKLRFASPYCRSCKGKPLRSFPFDPFPLWLFSGGFV